MQEIINILRQQLILCMQLLKVVQRQGEALVQNDARLVSAINKEAELAMAELNQQEKKKQQFLQQAGAASVALWLEKTEDSMEKQLALQLTDKMNNMLQQLQEAKEANKQYLDRNMKFIDFNINVMTQTEAGATYGSGPVQGRKMFQADV